MGGDITLSAAVRQNLLTLQSTADLMSGVQNKLATGLKVNSALDNPNSFFTASGLTARASDLSNLLEDMGQSVQTVKAADDGLQSITKLVEAAKAKANQALQTQSQYERAQFARQYNELLEQVEDVAKDSSYKGKNLLAGDGNDLTTIFNEDGTSKLTIDAVDYSDTTLSTGLNLSDLDEGKGAAASFSLSGVRAVNNILDAGANSLDENSLLSESTDFGVGDTITIRDTAMGGGAAQATLTVSAGTTVQDYIDTLNSVPGINAGFFEEDGGDFMIVSSETVYVYNDDASGDLGGAADIGSASATPFTGDYESLINSGNFKVGDTLTLTDGGGYELGSLELGLYTEVKDLVEFMNGFNGVSASYSSAQVTIESDVSLSLTSDNPYFNAEDFTVDPDGINVTAQQESGFSSDSKINRVMTRLNNALSSLRTQASEFGTNLSTVETRQDYTTSLINTLQEGAGKLTLADTNQEGANLLALQTRQQLASTSLSFASQADQTVLSLF